MKFVGYNRGDFISKDGTAIKGVNVYIMTEIDKTRGDGFAVERIYLAQEGKTAVSLLWQNPLPP